MIHKPSIHKLSRREWIASLTGGLGSIGLLGMLSDEQARAASTPTKVVAPRPRAEIPQLPAESEAQYRAVPEGRPLAARHVRPQARAAEVPGPAAVVGRSAHRTHHRRPAASPFEFKKYGRGGVDVSSLLPNIASVIDDICVIKSMYTFNPTHTPGCSLFHTGNIAATRPSMGAWISYGLGTENQEPARLRGAEPRHTTVSAAWRARASCPPNTRAPTSTTPWSSRTR